MSGMPLFSKRNISISRTDEINKAMFEELFTEKTRSLIGGKETDLQFSINLKEDVFNVHITGGPIHKDEAGKYFQFDSVKILGDDGRLGYQEILRDQGKKP